MTPIRDEIDLTLSEMQKRIRIEASVFPQLNKMAVLLEHPDSGSTKRLKDTIEKYINWGSDVEITEDDVLVLVEIFAAEETLLSHSPSETGQLAFFALDKGEKEQLFGKCEQMRKIVWASEVFDEPHKRRLQRRISAIELEISKERGMFDVILGGMSDFGEAAGKFGTDIKPLTDRMKEILSVTRNATSEYDQLPAPDEIKSLPAPDDPAE